MNKYIAAVIRHRTNVVEVLKCDGETRHPKFDKQGMCIDRGQVYGRIRERLYVPTYGQGLVKANQIEGK